MRKLCLFLLFGVLLASVQEQKSTREKIQQLQKQYEKTWKQFLDRNTGIDGYLKEWREGVGESYEKEVTPDELLESVSKKKVVFVGDHHTTPAIQKFHVTLIQKFHDKARKPLTLGVEYITSKETIKSAEKLGWKVISMEPTSSDPKVIGNREFDERDQEIADTAQKYIKEHPDQILVVIYGEAHLMGRKHAGERVTLDKAFILPVSDWIYWKVALDQQSLNLDGKYVRVKEDVYYPITGDPSTRLVRKR